MSFGFKSLGHAFGWIGHEIVSGARAIEKIIPFLQKNEAFVEGVTALVDPQAVIIERAAFHVLGEVLSAVKDADAAATAKGLLLELDAAVIADLKALANDLHGKLAAAGAVPKP